jgi:hypothetical protein
MLFSEIPQNSPDLSDQQVQQGLALSPCKSFWAQGCLECASCCLAGSCFRLTLERVCTTKNTQATPKGVMSPEEMEDILKNVDNAKPTYKRTKSSIPSKCCVCQQSIPPQTEIFTVPGKGAAHIACMQTP